MVFKCQEDSFLKHFTTRVISCDSATLDWSSPEEAVKKRLNGYNVICENTILFPEGGGQPCDFGTINGHPVRNVYRKGDEAIHFIECSQPLEEGAEVHQSLDWHRRLDHMQQHSGQHLITALFDGEFNYNTISWSLGTSTSYIELETTHLISRESLDTIENKANDIIREGRKVSVLLVEPDVAKELKDFRASRIQPPTDGLVRVIRIDGVESNMCCGTHVSNTSQLQCIKLLFAEKSKSSIKVHFVVGQRAIRKLGECFQREQQINLALKCGPPQHLEMINKLQSNLNSSLKTFQKLLKDFAIAEAEKLNNLPNPKPSYFTLHRKDGIEPDFIHTFLRNAPENICYFLTVSENVPFGGKGFVVLRGEPAVVQKLGPVFLELLEGKGAIKENNLQGKIQNLNKIPECESLLEQHFKSNSAKQQSNIETTKIQ